MLRIRIVFTGMMAAIAVTLVVSGASAQNVAAEPSDRPLALLAGLKPPPEIRTARHTKTARIKKAGARKLAAKLTKKTKAVTAAHSSAPPVSMATVAPSMATVTPPPGVWPGATPPADIAAAPPPETAPADTDPAPSEIAVGGQTVQVAAPDQLNAVDLAADNAEKETPTAALPDQADIAPAAQTVLASRATHEDTNAVGSTSWIAQALAALGGALAAGAVGWFLIGSGPVRMYG
jgi:hypothetical protein